VAWMLKTRYQNNPQRGRAGEHHQRPHAPMRFPLAKNRRDDRNDQGPAQTMRPPAATKGIQDSALARFFPALLWYEAGHRWLQ